jgi:DNA (cytosine-5)-methyltransferase 1
VDEVSVMRGERPLTFGSLFAGIGGFDLGFERAGLRCVWQVEIDPFCRKVLAKHWPEVRRHDDVRTFPPEGDWSCDVICGGFPCQDISLSGRGAGIDGERSGLWAEYARILRVLRPRFVVVENSPALTSRGLGRVLGDLADLGFDAEWSLLSACRMGAPHTRDRLFVVGHAVQVGLHRRTPAKPEPFVAGGRAGEVRSWADQPALRGVAYGLPGRLDRVGALGNAVMPQEAEWIGRQLLAATETP